MNLNVCMQTNDLNMTMECKHMIWDERNEVNSDWSRSNEWSEIEYSVRITMRLKIMTEPISRSVAHAFD